MWSAQVDLSQSRVLIRLDLNVPLSKDDGVTITDGPLTGLLARAVVVINGDGKVTYTEQVPEIVQEPNYDAAKAVVNS